MPSVNSREPYLITAIRHIADLEAKATLTTDEMARLDQYRRWLGEHYPDVSGALVREYRKAQDRLREVTAEQVRAVSESMPSVIGISTRPAMVWHEVGIPVGTIIDGAVVELCQAPDGTLTADLRIPAMQAASHG